MAYLSLYRKYRSQTFEEVLGQEHVTATLANAIEEDRVAHAYLFTGPRGTGKTSTARILAKALNCERGPTPRPCGECASCVAIAEGSSLDVIEMDAASHSKVDETREVLAGVPLATAGGRRKVYVIDEVHMLSTAAFNALLKTLEEPPAHVVFVLATTEAHKVLPTIVSRTQRFDFRRLSPELLQEHLAHVAKLEDIDIDAEALALVARHADGSARDALSVLDQLAGRSGPVSLEEVERMLGARHEDAFGGLFDGIAANDPGTVFRVVHQLMAQGGDARQLAEGVLEYARTLLLLKTAPNAAGLVDVSAEDGEMLAQQAGRFSGHALMRTLDLLATAITEMRNSPNHRLLLEVALVRAASPDTDASPAALVERLERLERRAALDERAPARPDFAAAEAPVQERRPRPAPGPRSEPGPAPESVRAESPAPPAPVAEPAGAHPGPEPAERPAQVGLGHVRDAWTVALKEVNKRSKRVWGLLSPSRPVRFDDDKLEIEVQSPFHQSEMEDERNRALLAHALHAALGVRPNLAFVPRGTEPPAPAPEAAESMDDVAEATPVASADDPVEMIKKGLKAEVVEGKGRR